MGAFPIREHEDPTELRKPGGDMVMRLTEAGLEGFFLTPVEALDAGHHRGQFASD